MLRFRYCLAFLPFLSSCSYQVVSSSISQPNVSKTERTFYVYDITDDGQGLLQSHIISALIGRNYPYCSSENSAALHIVVSPLNQTCENVGFSYAPVVSKKSKTDFLVSNESRLEINATVTVKSKTGTVLKTFIVQDAVYYDFQPDLSTTNIHEFSLGQYDSYNNASKIAQQELYERLGDLIAQRISYELA